VQSTIQTVLPSVVKVTSTAGRQQAVGSGDILNTNGYIVTNDHVVQGFRSFTVTLANGSSQPAQLVGQDPQDDLAVLKIAASGTLQPIAIADSSKLQVGEFVVAVGNPLDLGESATFGIVSALNRTASEAPSGPAGTLTGLVQTSAALNPGNSGGALVNLQGQLVGIPTLGAVDSETGTAANDIGYAIAANRASSIASQLIQGGTVTSSGQGFLGIQGEDVTAQLAAADHLAVQSGVLVAGFAADAAGQSPAQQAGIQVGDVITAANGQPIGSGGDLAAQVASVAPGSKVTLGIVRGTSQHAIAVTLGERPVGAQG
jgi:S1-C subfamily serine protease